MDSAHKRWMDCVLVLRHESVEVVETPRLKVGDQVVMGRIENGEVGIFVHTEGFNFKTWNAKDKFSFRTRDTRETPFSCSYD